MVLIVLINLRYFGFRYEEIRVMYISDRTEVYKYMGVKVTRGISIPKFCLLVTSEAQVRLRTC